MRIISGSLGGLNFDSPKVNKVHPMSEKVRGGLFNALGEVSELTVLDAFAGSGALSFEAVSRGAREITAVEKDVNAQKVIAANVAKLGLKNKVNLVKANVNTWLETSKINFDLVLLDPPYDNLRPELLEKLAKRAKLAGLVVISLPPAVNFSLSADFNLLKLKDYGDAELTFYRRIG